MPLYDYIKINRRYSRSVNLERDLQIADSVKGYILTPKVSSLIERFSYALSNPDSVRAWTVTGLYGTGKSAFAHFLTALCSDKKAAIRKNAFKVLEGSGTGIPFSSLDLPDSGLIKAVTTAQRESIAITILRGLHSGVNDQWGGKKGKKPNVFYRINELFGNPDKSVTTDNGAVIDLIKETARASKNGLLIIVDELSKNLESAAKHQTTGDLFLLQQIAELPAGAKDPKVFFIGLLHQSFADYSHSLSSAQRNEWAKVQGRFEDIQLTESSERLLYLIGNAIDHSGVTNFAPAILEWARNWQKELSKFNFSHKLIDKELSSIYPIHPVSALTLPILCNKFSQNDRTLFTFLASEEPHSFTSFLKTHSFENNSLPSLKVHQLYDYFIEYAGASMSLRPQYQRWVEVQSRISDAHDLDHNALHVLKTIGILNLISNTGSLKASRGMVVLAMCDQKVTKRHSDHWENVIDQLTQKGFITWRQQVDELRIWEGSDFNIDHEVAAQLEIIRTPLAEMLNEFYPLRPLVARKHSYMTGTLRYFDRQYIDSIPEKVEVKSSDCDGLIYYLLGKKPSRSSVPNKTIGNKPVIVIEGADVDALHFACNEYVALRNIEKNAKQLQADGVARKELKQRLFLAKNVLDDALLSAFNFQKNKIRCWVDNGSKTVKSDRALNELLSNTCDQSYDKGLNVWNELINRNQLSGQGAMARRELYEAMINNQGQERLCIEGNGPAYAIFESLLVSTGLYSKEKDRWLFQRPPEPSGVYEAWHAAESFCKSADRFAKPIDELFRILEQPPYGIKQGTIPILLLSVLLYHNDYLSVYFEGTYLPILTPTHFELLIKRPDKFSVKYFEISGLREQLFKELGDVISHSMPISKTNVRNITLLGVVNPLVKFIKKLPPYTLKAETISEEAKAVRKAVIEAREPDQLLFKTLPEALGVSKLDRGVSVASGDLQKFRSKLIQALQELEATYENVLNSSEDLLFKAFSVKTRRVSLRHDITVRASHLNGQVIEPVLRRFILAAAKISYNDRQWLESILMVISDKPVRSWTDQDVLVFETKLSDLARRFRNLEAIQDSLVTDPKGSFDTRKITYTYPDGHELNEVVWIVRDNKSSLEKMKKEILEKIPSLDKSTKLALFASLVEEALSEDQATETQDKKKEIEKHA